LLFVKEFLDQELISYRYSSCCSCSCWSDLFKNIKNSPRLCRFKSDLGEICQDCSSCKYTSTDAVGFSISRHSFKTAAMTSFHAEKCRRLVRSPMPPVPVY